MIQSVHLLQLKEHHLSTQQMRKLTPCSTTYDGTLHANSVLSFILNAQQSPTHSKATYSSRMEDVSFIKKLSILFKKVFYKKVRENK